MPGTRSTLLASVGSAALVLLAVPVAARSDGEVDVSLNPPNGQVQVSLGLGSPSYFSDTVLATAVDSDGRILLETDSLLGDGTHAIGLKRLNFDGTADTDFGNSSVAYLQIQGSTVPAGLLLQKDGKILVGGTAWDFLDTTFFVARLTVSGQLDTTFNAPWGYRTLDFFNGAGMYWETLAAMALQPDGKIVLAGDLAAGSNRDFGVARLDNDGGVDLPFGGQGCGCRVIAFDLEPNGSGDDFARAVALAADGRIVVVGTANYFGNDFDWAIARLTGGGLPDSTFNGSGTQFLDWGLSSASTDSAARVVVRPDGRLVVAGTATVDRAGQTHQAALLAGFRLDGSLDPTFGGGGLCTPLPMLLAGTRLGLALDARGRLLLGWDNGLDFPELAVGRFDADCLGRDLSFGASGFNSVILFAAENGFGDLVVAPDQRIVLTASWQGASQRGAAAARFWVADLFRDGLESGTTSRWSSGEP